MIQACTDADTAMIADVINDAAEAYRGAIPDDCWHEPYMALDDLRAEIDAGVRFSRHETAGVIDGVMGIQVVQDVMLIRHAYVRTAAQGKGIGDALLTALCATSDWPLLIGTWSAATWAIQFYEKRGFRLVTGDRKDTLLRTYWTVPEAQMANSVVLADTAWFARDA